MFRCEICDSTFQTPQTYTKRLGCLCFQCYGAILENEVDLKINDEEFLPAFTVEDFPAQELNELQGGLIPAAMPED